MSDPRHPAQPPTPEQGGGVPPWGGQVPPAPAGWPAPDDRAARNRAKNKRILGWAGYPIALIVGVAIGSGGAGASSDGGPKASGLSSVASSPAQDDAEPVEAAPAPDPAPAGVTAANYTVKAKTLRKQCFGSAGCNVSIRLTVGGDEATSGVAAELTVQISGDEDGPLVETISLDEDGQYSARRCRCRRRRHGRRSR
jgi:hypothetical protein